MLEDDFWVELVESHKLHFLLTAELVLVELVLPLVLDDLVVDAVEERREAVVVVLTHVLKRMVVAAGALEATAQEHLGRCLRAVDGKAQRTVEVRRRIPVGASGCGEHLVREDIKRLAGCQALADPVVKYLNTLGVKGLLLDPQKVRPLQRPKLRVFG